MRTKLTKRKLERIKKRKNETQDAVPFPTAHPESPSTGLVFPPTIYSNVVYNRGVRVGITSSNNDDESGLVQASQKNHHDYYVAAPHSSNKKNDELATLDPQDSELWFHKYAAKSAAQSYFPMNVFRRLGTITRTLLLVEDQTNGPFALLSPIAKQKKKLGRKGGSTSSGMKRKILNISRPAAKKEALAEFERKGPQSTTIVAQTTIDIRAQAIMDSWSKKTSRKVDKHWDPHTGSLTRQAVNDDAYVPIRVLLKWIKNQKELQEPDAPTETCVYGEDLCRIPIGTKHIVESLCHLCNPEDSLYDQPILIAYPIVSRIVDEDTNAEEPPKKRPVRSKSSSPSPRSNTTTATTTTTTTTTTSWKIEIGVYCNRLLPEIMTCEHLRDVMAALDPNSFRLVQPLQFPPLPKEPVFDSSPFPRVVMEKEDTVGSDDEEEEEKKSEDVALVESTRDSQQVSAFSFAGLLKLFENRGCDVSNWATDIAPVIVPQLKLNLMLHQQHAICWMVQMEGLGGMGINSILWQEREFLDGGKYYYSPALGQLRLTKPPTSHGGLLCDEMGLGKSIEVLGLILATLETVKKNRKGLHATLIVVPPALASQWLDEIEKTVENDSLVVGFLDFKTGYYEARDHTIVQPKQCDVVVTTYSALDKPFSFQELSSHHWGRIVLDEMQEIRSSTTKISKACAKLQACRRWMLSGTPLFDSIDDLRGELNFLQVEPYSAALEDGFFQFSITNHWLQHSTHAIDTLRVLGHMFMLRRSKSMTIRATGAPLLGLKPLTVEFVPIVQSDSERALYCFLEYIVARELKRVNRNTTSITKREQVSRRLCLRLLGDMCTSAVLVNGGIGVQSQLKKLNHMLITFARRQAEAAEQDESSGRQLRVMSCDDAIRYLSQLQENVRTGTDQVALLRLGFGQGLARRSRAEDSFEQQLEDAQSVVAKADSENTILRQKRAKARWHSALEKVTTGQFIDGKVQRKFQTLWKWRSLVAELITNTQTAPSLPSLLLRGWRPSQAFVTEELVQKHPDFAWAHPYSPLKIQHIPKEVCLSEVLSAVSRALSDNVNINCDSGISEAFGSAPRVKVYAATSMTQESTTWEATLVFSDEKASDCVLRKASSAQGVALPHYSDVPQHDDAIDVKQQAYEDATAAYAVQPTDFNRSKVSKARKNLERAQAGLRIVHASHKYADGGVIVSPAIKSVRSLAPASRQSLLSSTTFMIDKCGAAIYRNVTEAARSEERINRLSRAKENGVSPDVQAMSAFDSLQALQTGNTTKTHCPICLGCLGESTSSDADDGDSSSVSMIKCGHLFCKQCLCLHVRDSGSRYFHSSPQCPTCRGRFEYARDVVHVDPSLRESPEAVLERRQNAKRLVEEASRMLKTSAGQLDERMWEQLFLSIDVPDGVDASLDSRVTSIPRDVLAHFRSATGMPVHCGPKDSPTLGSDQHLSSKIKALLKDLPRDERSVVFSSQKATIKHLQCVLYNEGIGCRALFTGQRTTESENALSAWHSSSAGNELIPFPVLLVQSGAAASGLTLTAACKMFLMEPFERYEEEQQAYARCHRYGQTKAVHCKCYFTPVSVESRLLEWRRKAAVGDENGSAAATKTSELDPHLIYKSLSLDASDDEGEAEEENRRSSGDYNELSDQMSFLLGFENQTGEQTS